MEKREYNGELEHMKHTGYPVGRNSANYGVRKPIARYIMQRQRAAPLQNAQQPN